MHPGETLLVVDANFGHANGIARQRASGDNRNMVASEVIEAIPLAMDASDVYQVIGYALKHSQEIAAYLQQRQTAISDLESGHPEWRPAGLRKHLLARRERP